MPTTRTSTPTPETLLKTHDDQDRRPMHVVVCAHAYKALQDFADANGATVTGLIDAIAHSLPTARPTPNLEAVAGAARAIDVERRRKRYEDR